ncbi:hypothetical protein C0995_002358 [Termitomyces sp. Mi166|nr:hypothetical protein C0995_002358 [Termitomyces sp. Mi166\
MLTRTLTLSAIVSLAAAQVSISMPSPLVAILANPSASIVDPVNSWLAGLCAAPACSNTTLAAVVGNATSGCSAEFASFGISSSNVPAITALVQQYYPTVRKAACLKDGNTNCVTQTLTNAQSVLGTLSVNNIATIVSSGEDINLPTNVTCTNCVKAIYNTVNTGAPGILNPEGLQDTCGSSFIDGTTPAGISESASDATQSTTTSTTEGNGATQLSFGTLSGASIVAALALLV